jgi:pantoate--beta-alanine ligase
MCEKAGVDIIFAPEASEMYPNGKNEITLVCPPYAHVDKLCGSSRTGHFDGVASVVAKLFNIVKPQRAYFGKKDAQQLFIIKRMVEDLNFDVEIVPCEIVREKDGLAMSSRNAYLTPEGRLCALKLGKALFCAKELYQRGEKDVNALTDAALAILEGVSVEYFEILDTNSFEKISTIANKGAIALTAANIHQKDDNNDVRLIDNMEL